MALHDQGLGFDAIGHLGKVDHASSHISIDAQGAPSHFEHHHHHLYITATMMVFRFLIHKQISRAR
jgi:hypothetical protein